jgi:hypothetical protein
LTWYFSGSPPGPKQKKIKPDGINWVSAYSIFPRL